MDISANGRAIEERARHSRLAALSARAALLIGLVATFVLVVLFCGEVARRFTAESILADARARLPSAASALRGELEKQRALPLILKEDPTVMTAIATRDPAQLGALNEKLDRLARATRAAVIYILDASGTALAASNFREPTSFVGSDYRFRDYYSAALANGTAEQYALGTVSQRPGVYFSARMDRSEQRGLGVVVVKVELDAVEADWQSGGQPVFVSDERGIVLATSVPAWRFRTLRPIANAEAAEIRRSLQFGEASLVPLRLETDPALDGFVSADTGDGKAQRFALAQADVPAGLPGWRIHLLAPAGRELSGATNLARLVAGLVLAILLLAGFLLFRRGRLARLQRKEKERAAAELETRVIERTMDLASANQRLTGEIAEREKAEARIATLRDDLAQANRLATLGQVTAGVAHEINQPLAAIRAYAENAQLFLRRQDGNNAAQNLERVVGLTDRIASITDTLRGFARRGRSALEPLSVEAILDGAMLILRSRIRESGVELERRSVGGEAIILGGRIRLEQVLVNLVRNAVEALEGREHGRITVETVNGVEEVTIAVSDNGPGVPPEILPVLFTPFKTSKAQGTGLGLVIASDIVSELGGVLSATSRPGEGACFTIRLPGVPV
ncbi:ATP-binding protein [Mesorhizobium sp. RP14(2022)]|uniref:histidine kinase n=1 Tax=Mesorhizobium liriopis TaxID=2953882 RepID=A0ABT1CAJ8_9HYPH|nr:ATP-binding protein [Mesorhizobium liriopis]MCO6051858.1 ATP-binding protein [Mesorhizobium liriopis]